MNVGLVVLLAATAASVLLRLPGALITVASLGLPLLFLLYARQSGIYRDFPRWPLLVTALLGIGIGVGWVLLADELIFRQTGSPFDAGLAGERVLREGLGVAEGGAILMMIPAVVVRILRPPLRESLDGFVIGVLGALSFTAAATFTRLAPQFAAGPSSQAEPLPYLFIEAGVRAVTVPLTAACAGGMIGAALWFHRPSGETLPRGRLPGAVLTFFGVAVLAIYGIVGVIDSVGIPQTFMLMCQIAMAITALIMLRCALQLALLHERHAPAEAEPLLCLHCRNVVPELVFCPCCGAATIASSQASLRERRRLRPTTGSDSSDSWPGYGLAAATYVGPAPHRFSSLRLSAAWCVGIVVVTAPLIGISALTVRPVVQYNCPPDCGRPLIGVPVATNPRFTAPDGSFSMSYPAPGTAYQINFDDRGVTARFTGGDGGTMRMMGEPAVGRTPEQVAESFLRKNFPDARTAYEIPNAMVGYQSGFGEVADIWPQDGDASYRHLRVILLTAVKNDVALTIAAVGPYREFGPDFGPGRPSGANLQLAEDMGRYINGFMWRGDPPR